MLTAVRQLASADLIAMATWLDAETVELTECDPPLVPVHVLRAPVAWEVRHAPHLLALHDARRMLPSIVTLGLPYAPAAACVVHGPRVHAGIPAASLLLVWRSASDVPASIRRDPSCVQHLLVPQSPLSRRTMPVPQSLLDAILAHVPQGIVFVDGQRSEAMVNAAAARWLRVPAGVLTGEEIAQAFDRVALRERHAEYVHEEVRRVAADETERVDDWMWELDGAGGTTLRVTSIPVAAGAGRGRLWTFDDISHERELLRQISHQRTIEEKLRQVQKLEMVGRLAASVAHDFNNLLTIIGGSAEMLDDLKLDPDRRSDLDNIGSATDRARRLTRQLLTFTRQQVEQAEVFAVDERLRAAASLLNKVLAPDRLVLALEAPGACILADPNQVELALLNLLANARDAMPDGGVVTLHTSIEALDGEELPGNQVPLAGAHVAIAVRDHGTGFDAETHRRMFEPFFTTKPAGHGTGLGLATVLAIAQRAGGGVRSASVPGQGATFTILIPLAQVSAGTKATPAVAQARVTPSRDVVLLVDDDGGPRETLRRVLQHEGFDVRVASSGEEALQLLADDAAGVRLLLTDYVMPQMNGRELLEQVRARFGDLPAIIMSGYSPDASTSRDLASLQAGFIAKPFGGRQLATMIRERLARATPAAVVTGRG